VFAEILKHRNFEPLIIDEIFEVPDQDESELHSESGLKADNETAKKYAQFVKENYSDERIETIVSKWYLT
jgi:hypothetical protein